MRWNGLGTRLTVCFINHHAIKADFLWCQLVYWESTFVACIGCYWECSPYLVHVLHSKVAVALLCYYLLSVLLLFIYCNFRCYCCLSPVIVISLLIYSYCYCYSWYSATVFWCCYCCLSPVIVIVKFYLLLWLPIIINLICTGNEILGFNCYSSSNPLYPQVTA